MFEEVDAPTLVAGDGSLDLNRTTFIARLGLTTRDSAATEDPAHSVRAASRVSSCSKVETLGVP